MIRTFAILALASALLGGREALAVTLWVSPDGSADADYTREDPGSVPGLAKQFGRYPAYRDGSFEKGYDEIVFADGVYCPPDVERDAQGGYVCPWSFTWDGRTLILRSASGDPKKCYFRAPDKCEYYCPLAFFGAWQLKTTAFFRVKDIGFRNFSWPYSCGFTTQNTPVEFVGCEWQDADGVMYKKLEGAVNGRPECGCIVELDFARDFIRDQRTCTAGVGIGYAGCVTYRGGGNEGPFEVVEDLYLRQPDLLATRLREAGARVFREWTAMGAWQRGMLWSRETKAGRKWIDDLPELDPHVLYGFRRKHGIRIVLDIGPGGRVLDPDTLKLTEDIAVLQRVAKDYLRWILDNGYKDQVIGFELGNEPYFGNEPEKYAVRCAAVVRAMHEVWPDAKIGMPLAEYTSKDPDLKAVRARFANAEWVKGNDFFHENRWHQWSGRFVEELKRQGVLKDISHVIYHFYGGNILYGCSGRGLQRITNFAKIYPEVADKKVWITEWRERSDENDWCHQTFRSTLFKGCYMITCLGDPRVEAMNCHNIFSLAGGLSFSDGHHWYVQWDGRGVPRPDLSGDGKVKVELGPMGPLMRLYTEALQDHPVLMKIGNSRTQGPGSCTDVAAMYYDGGPGPVEWLAAANPDRSSLALLVTNTGHEEWSARVRLPGVRFGAGRVRQLTMRIKGRPDLILAHGVTGEAPLWETNEWQTPVPKESGHFPFSVPGDSVVTIEVPMKGGAK